MKLKIEEKIWWGLHTPGQKTTNYTYDLDRMKVGERVSIGDTLEDNNGKLVPVADLYFVFEGKDGEFAKLKIGSERWSFNGKDFRKKPAKIKIKAGEKLSLNTSVKDTGADYTISIEK